MYETKDSLYEQIDITQKRINEVFDYINSNPNSDPNAYEMNELMFSVAEIGSKGRNFESEPYSFLKDEKYSKLRGDFYAMMKYRLEQLNSPETGLISSRNDPLYKYFDEATMRMSTLNSLGNKQVSDIFSKACGINLYIKQRIRDIQKTGNEEVIYDNKQELIGLLDSIDKLDNKSYYMKDLKPLLDEIHLAIGKTPREFNEIKQQEQQKNIE